MIINRASYERGLFHGCIYKSEVYLRLLQNLFALGFSVFIVLPIHQRSHTYINICVCVRGESNV